jgi:hypothetical protein
VFDLLHALSQELEDWSTRHSHTIALFTAVGIALSVIIALWASVTAKRAALLFVRAQLGVASRLSVDGRRTARYVVVELTNRGSLPMQLTELSLAWWIAFHTDKVRMVTPLDFSGTDREVQQRNFPITLVPNMPELFYLFEARTWEQDLVPILENVRLGRRITAKLLRARVFIGLRSFPVAFHISFRRQFKAMLERNS